MTNNKYFVIQEWMVSELNLKGNERDVYAIIYGFSQDSASRFTGSRQYLANLIGCGLTSVSNALDSLVKKGLIVKETRMLLGGMSVPVYYCKKCSSTTESEHPLTKSEDPSTETEDYNIDNKLKNNIDINNTKVLFSEDCNNTTLNTSAKPRKKNLYEKCGDIIQEYTNNSLLRNALYGYRDMALEKSASEHIPMYVNVFKGKINSLALLSNDMDTQIRIVQQSVSRGWMNFYELKESQSRYKDAMNENGVVNSRREFYEEGGIEF